MFRVSNRIPTERGMINQLMRAAQTGAHEFIFSVMAKDDSLVNARDHKGFTALMYAAQNNQLETVNLLLKDWRLNASLTCNEGFDALHYAESEEIKAQLRPYTARCVISDESKDFGSKPSM